jgi:hypothetical protein
MTWIPGVFEGPELAGISGHTAEDVRGWLKLLLDRPTYAQDESERVRERAIELFGIETVGPQWREFLGDPRPQETDLARLEWRASREGLGGLPPP